MRLTTLKNIAIVLMGNNKNNIVSDSSLDFYLGVCGFSYPTTEAQLDLFDTIYQDFDYQLKDVKIDCIAIIQGSFISKSVISLFENEHPADVNELKMAARKGIQNLPNDVIDKMYSKHRKGPDDKE